MAAQLVFDTMIKYIYHSRCIRSDLLDHRVKCLKSWPVKKAQWNSASKWLSQTGNCSLLALADKEHKRTASSEIQAHKTKLKVCQRHNRSYETCVEVKSNFQNIDKNNILQITKCIKYHPWFLYNPKTYAKVWPNPDFKLTLSTWPPVWRLFSKFD